MGPFRTAVAIAGTDRLIVDTRVAPLNRYVYATSSNLDANCTDDGADLLMIGYEEVKQ